MLTINQKIRALRRVIDDVSGQLSDYYDDPISRHYGCRLPRPYGLYQRVSTALRQLRISRADAIVELDRLVPLEAKHTPYHDAPMSLYQSAFLEDE